MNANPTDGLTAFERVRRAVENQGLNIKPERQDSFLCQGPGHSEADLSVHVTGIAGQTLIKSFADEEELFLETIGLGWADLFDNPKTGNTYEYYDGAGNLARTVTRSPAKQFNQKVLDKETVPLYHLDEVREAVKAGAPIYVCEGEKDADTLRTLGVCATTSPQGAQSWNKADYTPLADAAQVFVVADNDKAGIERAKGLTPKLERLCAGQVEAVAPAEGLKDAADHIMAGHTLQQFEPLKLSSPLDGMFSSEWLFKQQFPPLEYAVPGIVPEGLALLAAPPKIGKSWMVLGLAKACSEGNHAFGVIPVDRRPVLYMALEDGPRRLQNRLGSIRGAGDPNLFFLTELKSDLLTTLDSFLRKYRKPLIILDTLGKVRDVYSGNDAYQKDYAQLGVMKEMIDRYPGASMIVVHHTRKGAADDFVQEVSGTQGLTGAVDTILTLRRDRNSGDALLNVTARDAMEGQYALTMGDNGVWELIGDDLEESAEAARKHHETSNLGDGNAKLIQYINDHPEGVKRSDVATFMGWSDETASTNLSRLYKRGSISKSGRGVYVPNITNITDITPNTERQAS